MCLSHYYRSFAAVFQFLTSSMLLASLVTTPSFQLRLPIHQLTPIIVYSQLLGICLTSIFTTRPNQLSLPEGLSLTLCPPPRTVDRGTILCLLLHTSPSFSGLKIHRRIFLSKILINPEGGPCVRGVRQNWDESMFCTVWLSCI